MHYDIFNGDADGIFALHQYRLAHPQPDAKRITGVKRDIKLLNQVEDVQNCDLTVFDVSLDSNRLPLTKINFREKGIGFKALMHLCQIELSGYRQELSVYHAPTYHKTLLLISCKFYGLLNGSGHFASIELFICLVGDNNMPSIGQCSIG